MKALVNRAAGFISRLSQIPLIFPLFLLLVSGIAYLYQLSSMGFYWDDWQAVFLSRSTDPGLVWRYFFYDRPFSAWTYALSLPLLQMHAPLWQVVTLLLRWLGVLCLYWTFVELWPDWKVQWRWVTLLMLVFPAFTMQSMAVAFSQHFTTFALFALSFFLMVFGWNHRRWYWIATPISWFACGVSLFSMEYFVGLEALRWVILGMLAFGAWKITRRGLRSFILAWLPYALILGVYLWYRLVFYPAQLGEDTTNYPTLLAGGFSAIPVLAHNIWQDAMYLLFSLWSGIYKNINFESTAFILGWALGVILAGLALLLFRPLPPAPGADTPRPGYNKLAFGLFALLAGGLPVWSLGQQVIAGRFSGRYALAPLIGAAVAVVWLVERLLRTRLQRNLALAVLLAFSISAQVQAVNLYRKDWDVQRNLYWQLYWRAPALKDGTTLLAAGVSPLTMEADYQIMYAFNALYHPQEAGGQLPLAFMTLRQEGFAIPELKPDRPITYNLRNLTFTGNTSQALAYYYDPGQGCLRVLDTVYAGDTTLPEGETRLLPLSNVAQILPQAQDVPLKQVFGLELAHGWCYTFQKADLARQQGDWQTVLTLAGEGGPANLQPQHGTELAPFIEAFARTAHWDWALQASQMAVQTTPGLEPWVCTQWQNLSSMPGGAEYQQQITTAFGCK